MLFKKLFPIHKKFTANEFVFLISSAWRTILDAVSPTWEQLENAMVAVKTVVHGLVDFIQNYSRKGHETPQVSKVISLLTALISNGAC